MTAAEATVRLNVYVPDDAVSQRVLEPGRSIVVGREPGCDVCIDHHSVSRRHLSLNTLSDGDWEIEDLGSKNGTRMGGHRVSRERLVGDSCWFAVGDVYCQFERIPATALCQEQAQLARRKHTSMAWNQRLHHGTEAQRLIGDLLQGFVETAQAKRGFLLTLGQQAHWRVRACYGIEPAEMSGLAFSGSRSAVNRALKERRPIYLSDRRDQAWLQARDSVLAGGIRALVAMPLFRDGQVLALAYADTDDAERVYTALDAQLLAALVDHAGNVLSALALEGQLAQVSALLRVHGEGQSDDSQRAPHWPAGEMKAAG